jgi:hypothetical protein
VTNGITAEHRAICGRRPPKSSLPTTTDNAGALTVRRGAVVHRPLALLATRRERRPDLPVQPNPQSHQVATTTR